MDCNNYSYSNNNSFNIEITSYEGEDNTIYLEQVTNFFGDHFYYVYDIFGKIEPKTFDFYILKGWEDMKSAYQEAVKYYNSVVPDAAAIPLF